MALDETTLRELQAIRESITADTRITVLTGSTSTRSPILGEALTTPSPADDASGSSDRTAIAPRDSE